MLVIYAEKPDMASKIATCLYGITLPSGKKITSLAMLDKSLKEVKALQQKQGYLDLVFKGEDAKITWGYGHMVTLKNAKDYNPAYANFGSLPTFYCPPKFELKPIDKGGTSGLKNQLRLICDLFKKADWIINATDNDREGEVIFGYIYEYCGCKTPFKRAWFSEVSQKEFTNSFDNLHTSAEIHNIELAGRARAIADYVTGNNITVRMTLDCLSSRRQLLTSGRVQTPTLNIIVQKEKEIKKFKPEKFYTINATFKTPSGNPYTAVYEQERIPDKTKADAILKGLNTNDCLVTKVDSKVIVKPVPMLYSLSTLMMDASNIYGLKAKTVAQIAQKLYDNGFTTYPRTSSPCLGDSNRPEANAYLDNLENNPDYSALIKGRPRTFNNKFFNSKLVDSHPAITPTTKDASSLTGNDKKIYDLVAWSIIRMLYPDAQVLKTNVTTTVSNTYNFKSTGSIISSAGWMAVHYKAKENILPAILMNDRCTGEFNEKEGKTEPPKRYTDATLLAVMKSAGKFVDDVSLKKILDDPSVKGIGTEATRAGIIDGLEVKGYIYRDGKTIIPTALGEYLIDVMPIPEIKLPDLTAQWEQKLSMIAKGTYSYDTFIDEVKAKTEEWCNVFATKKSAIKDFTDKNSPYKPVASDLICPICGKKMNKYAWGYACDGYKKDCDFTIGKICGKTISDTQIKKLLTKGKTDLIRGFISKNNKKFNAVLIVGNDKNTGKKRVIFDF